MAAVKEAPAATEQAPAVVRKPPAPIGSERFKSGEYERQVHVANADEGTTPADLTHPDYWAHVADKLKAWDLIEVRANNGTWFAQLLVLDVSRAWARVHTLSVHMLSDYDVSQTQAQMPYYIKHNGPQDKWTVIRRADGEIVSKEHSQASDAKRWMDERLKAG